MPLPPPRQKKKVERNIPLAQNGVAFKNLREEWAIFNVKTLRLVFCHLIKGRTWKYCAFAGFVNFAKFRANICFFYIKIETCPSRQFVISAVRPILHKKCHLLRTCIKCNVKKTLASLTSWYIAVLHNMNLSFLERKTGFCSVRQVGEFMNYCWVFWR